MVLVLRVEWALGKLNQDWQRAEDSQEGLAHIFTQIRIWVTNDSFFAMDSNISQNLNVGYIYATPKNSHQKFWRTIINANWCAQSALVIQLCDFPSNAIQQDFNAHQKAPRLQGTLGRWLSPWKLPGVGRGHLNK